MGIDTLLATMERRVDTPATPCTHAGVTAKPAPVKACTLVTPVTPVTPQNGNTAQLDCEWYEERAGILEFDAGYPRHKAERLAYLEVTKWQQQLRCRTLQ